MAQQKPKRKFNQKTILAVQKFVNSRSWKDAKQFVEDNRRLLLTKEADDILDEIENKYSKSLWGTELPIIQEHRELLARRRKESIAAAFAERVPKTKEK